MRRRSHIPLFIFVLLSAGMASGEDRIERFVDQKNASGKVAKELVFRNDELMEERIYDTEGALAEEDFFGSSSLPFQMRKYIRAAGRLDRVEYEDAVGMITGSLSYRYDRDGRLLGVDSDGDLGTTSTGMISTGAIPQASWVSGTSSIVLGYDDAGRASIIELMKDGAAVSIERRSYGAKGLPSLVHTEEKNSGKITDLAYDQDGRLTLRTVTPAKGPQAKTEYRYDDSGRLVEELTRRGGGRIPRTLAYSASGSISREETRRDGVLLLIVEYIENGRVEQLYDKGILFVKATYIGGRKIKDEFYIDGSLARTREY